MSRDFDQICRDRIAARVGLRFELFYAVQALRDAETRVHAGWRQQALAALPAAGHQALAEVGGGATLWGVVADTLRTAPPDEPFKALVARLSALPVAAFQREIVVGALHDEAAADRLIGGTLDLAGALAKSAKPKREWLAFVGLFPYEPDKPLIKAFQRLLDDPEGFRRSVVTLLTLFWRHVFAATWRGLRPQLERSAAEKARLLAAVPFADVARAALLRIEVDAAAGTIGAVRGGYKLAVKDLKAGWLLPSAFNDKRFWSAYEEPDGVHVFFPFFDPGLVVTQGDAPAPAEPALDVALIFKALGEPTRFALAEIIAAAPTTSVELARRLGVSKPTVTHHVHLLREAGLLVEKPVAGAVQLSLRRDVIETLGARAVRRLFRSPS